MVCFCFISRLPMSPAFLTIDKTRTIDLGHCRTRANQTKSTTNTPGNRRSSRDVPASAGPLALPRKFIRTHASSHWRRRPPTQDCSYLPGTTRLANRLAGSGQTQVQGAGCLSVSPRPSGWALITRNSTELARESDIIPAGVSWRDWVATR
ncbi:hypothetical protein BT67DRAFT_272142 [Trichocladium antarcticum]|uniref:Uncharacterized protein n=1 Tax=Trichocladium antarcticum TaxID=1450529 RepID=A0AAN6UM95_9PEZI|nr:hypothetical protein BT67DRAFT_272142 [Trichocladium antarcticum]